MNWFEKIKQMTFEEMTDFLYHINVFEDSDWCRYKRLAGYIYMDIKDEIEDFLKREVSMTNE